MQSSVAERTATRPIYLMLLVSCALYNTNDWVFALPFASLFAAGILSERIINHWLYWTLVTSLLGSAVGRLWLSEGNHLFLLFYLSLIALVASHSSKPRSVFRLNARLVIGLVFALAIFWKVVSEDFISGFFYSHLLVTDERLSIIALLVTDLSRSDVAANRQALIGVLDTPTKLISHPGIQSLATVLTLLTLILEAAVAIAFLTTNKISRRVRSPILLFFIIGTYTLVPVPSFATAIACLGYAETDCKVYQTLFLAVFIVIPITALRYYLLPI